MMMFARCVLAMLVTTSASPPCSDGSSCNADDSLMLQVAFKQGIRQGQSASEMLKAVEVMVEKIVTGQEKITEATRLALITIDQEMDNIIAQASQTHQDSQGTVDRAKQSIEACGTATTTSHSEADGINDLAATVTTARNNHNTCRGSESTLKQDDTTKCDDLNSYAGNLHSTAPSCSCSGAALTRQCVQQSKTWFDTSETTWGTKQGLCDDATALTTTKRTDCNNKQGTLESAFCAYATKLNTVCHTQDTCRSTEITLRNQTHASVAVSEVAFKAEYESAKHVKCLLDVLNATDDAGKRGMLNTCRAATVDSSHLSITYHAIPSAATCDRTPVATVPGDDAWRAAEYDGKAWNDPSKAPVIAVIACPAAHPPAAPTHSAPVPAVKRTCADHLAAGSTTTGMYDLEDGDGNAYQAKCDMDHHGGGWTRFGTIQSRSGLTCTGDKNQFCNTPENTEFVDTCAGEEWIFSRSSMISGGGQLMAREINAPHKTFLIDWLYAGSKCTGEKFFKIVTGDYSRDADCHPQRYDFSQSSWIQSHDGWCNGNDHSQYDCVAQSYSSNGWPAGTKGIRFHYGTRDMGQGNGGSCQNMYDWWTGWTSGYGSSSDLVENFNSWTGKGNGPTELFYRKSTGA